MRGDDRLMTILTGLVLTVALVAVAQRSEILSDLPRSAQHDPRDDVVILAPGGVALIDVAANDRGASAEDGRRILITREPDCGAAWRHDGVVAYSASPDCGRNQSLRYCIADGDACREAEVSIILDAAATPARSPSGTPVVVVTGGDVPGGLPYAAYGVPVSPGGFRVEGQTLAPRDKAPFAAIGLPLGADVLGD